MTKIEKEFNPSEKIIAIQSAICGLKKDANNPFHKSKYMNLSTIVNTLKPVLYDNECYSSHQLGIGANDKPYLETKICYKDGSIILACKSPLPVKDSNDPQKLGSAITYMRRYNLTALLEIEEDDDDGNEASNKRTPSLSNVTKGAEEDVRQVQLKAAEKFFQKTKEEIEGCGSLGEIESILEREKKGINRLKKYYTSLYEKILDAHEGMKSILDPENNE
jgi:hypothetical protein